VRLRPLLQSSAFRLTLVYAAVFELSVAVLFAVIYFGTAQSVRNEIEDEIERELAALQQDYRTQGAGRLVIIIAERATAPENRDTLYLLQDARGMQLAGNLGPVRYFVGWSNLPPELAAARPRRPAPIRTKALLLPDGVLLAVGQSTARINEVHDLVIRAFAWASIATLVLALAGGALVSLRFLRRVDAIERTGREIMEGNLARRLPVGGAGDEFDRLSTSLNAMLERIQSLMEGLKQVSNDIAHDLRTPLARLRQRLEAARLPGKTADDQAAAIDRAIEDTDALLRTFSALVRIAQIESGSRRAGFSEVDLSAVFAGMVETYAAVAEDRGQRVSGTIAPDIKVRGDRELLIQVLSNLVENTLTHSPPGAEVTLALERRDGRIVGRVADNGPGIPPDQREKVFRRFYRLDASRATPGSGLGLSLVAAIAALHGIEIELGDNKPGLVVTLRFPPPARKESA
jgi:signal transduction histidine kinase